MFMTFNYTKLNLSKCNVSWAVTIKQNMASNVQPLSTLVCLGFHKKGLFESC
jgi:hypothetical protein